jgi:hypothetical protein
VRLIDRMYVELETADGETVRYNGVASVSHVPADDHGGAFVRVSYLVPDESADRFPDADHRSVDIEDARISKVEPTDL